MYFYGKSIQTSDSESENLAFLEPPETKKKKKKKEKMTAPEMFKTIVAITRYIDFLYMLGDQRSSARNCHVTVKYTCHFSLKIPKNT